jgi:hypothetical protein
MFDESIVKLTTDNTLTQASCSQCLLCGAAVAAGSAKALGSSSPVTQTIACLFNLGTRR